MIINCTKDDEYYTQRNNTLYPHEACMPTCYAMAAEHAGCEWACNSGIQPEDMLMQFLRSNEAYAYARQHFPCLAEIYPPNEIHGVLPWAYKRIGGSGFARFATDWKVEQLVFYVLSGYGVILSGRVPHYKYGHIHHVVCLAGIETRSRNIKNVRADSEIDIDTITGFIIDDPYGDFRKGYGYKNYKGNNVYV